MTINLTGLATGIDTTELIAKLMTIDRQPRARVLAQQTDLKASKAALQAIADSLKKLQTASQALTDRTLFSNKQTVDVANTSAATATVFSGAATGGYALDVVRLARSSQASYAFTAPTADTTISVAGSGWNDQIEVKAGTKTSDLVARINGDSTLHVVASVTTVDGVERISFASRATGASSGFTASASGVGVFSDETLRAGQDALIRIDGQEHLSASNVFDNAIPGVRLQLRGVTSTATTVNVGAPGADVKAVTDAVKTFVDAYNATLDLVRSVGGVSATSKGQLGGDVTVTQLQDQLRSALIAGGPSGLSLPLEALGITTGKASGTATYSSDAIQGRLTFDTAALEAALTADPGNVRTVLGTAGVVGGLATMIGTYTGAAGSLTSRISDSDRLIGDLGNQMDALDVRLAARETALKAQFARLEATISKWNDQGSWLDGQVKSLQTRS